MSLLTQTKQQIKRTAIYSWANLLSHVPEFPRFIYISLTNACNHRCIVCAHRSHMKKEKGFMRFNTFKKIIDQLPKNKYIRIYLMKQGESLLNKDLPHMLKYAKETRPCLELALHTNGTLLNDKIFKNNLTNSILSYIDFLSFSIFSVNQKIYKEIHGGNNYKRVFGNLVSFYKKFIKHKRMGNIKIYIDYVRCSKNKNEKNKKVFRFFKEKFPKWNIGIHFPYNFQKLVNCGIQNCFSHMNEKMYPICVYPWNYFTILWDGKVSYCFVEPEEKIVLGDINKNSINKIWNNIKYKNFRKLIVKRKYSLLLKQGIRCKNCSWLFGQKGQGFDVFSLYIKAKNIILATSKKDALEKTIINYKNGHIDKALYFLSLLESINDKKYTKAEKYLSQEIKKLFAHKSYFAYWAKMIKKYDKVSLSELHISKYF